MATEFPVPLDRLLDRYRVTSMTLDILSARQQSRVADGAIITGRMTGADLWQGSVTFHAYRHGCAGGIRAMLSLLRQPGASVLLRDVYRTGPRHDPGGVVLNGATVTLSNVLANNREIMLAGLPSGYRLAPGDYLSFKYGTNPVRYAFHQVVEGRGANASGQLRVEVTPHIRPGWVAGATVELVRPAFKAVLTGASVGRSGPLVTEGHSFEFIQTLR